MPRQKQWCVYLIKLTEPLGSDRHKAQYYLGCTNDLSQRLKAHQTGQGSKMLKAANERGIEYRVIKYVTVSCMRSARYLERKLKAKKNHRNIIYSNWSELLDPMALKESDLIDAINQHGIKRTLDRLSTALRQSNHENAIEVAEEIEEISFYLGENDNEHNGHQSVSRSNRAKETRNSQGRDRTQTLGTLGELPY